MVILNGKIIADEETKKLKEKVSQLKVKPKFAILQVGNLPESNKYISKKIEKSNEIGIEASWIKFDQNVEEEKIINEIKKMNKLFDGLIVQLPLPSHLNKQNILNNIDINKDIDGLSELNMKNFYNGKKPFHIPATARAILLLLNSYNISLKDKKILVIGESDLVGKPTKNLLSKVSKFVDSTNEEKGIKNSQEYDILIVAAGKPKLIRKNNVKNGAVVVDVGITILDNNKIIGDVDFDNVKEKVYAISPSIGGVGPLTVICLLKNLIESLI